MPLRFPFSTVAIRQRYGVKGFENLNSISIGPFRRETLSDAKNKHLASHLAKNQLSCLSNTKPYQMVDITVFLSFISGGV